MRYVGRLATLLALLVSFGLGWWARGSSPPLPLPPATPLSALDDVDLRLLELEQRRPVFAASVKATCIYPNNVGYLEVVDATERR